MSERIASARASKLFFKADAALFFCALRPTWERAMSSSSSTSHTLVVRFTEPAALHAVVARYAGVPTREAGYSKKVIETIKAGFALPELKVEMEAPQARKDTLQAQVSAVNDPPPPALHPNIAEVFRQKATTLAAGLEHDDQRDAAREALRGFVEKIVIPSGDGPLQVVGNLGAMLQAAAGQKMPSRQAVGYVGCGGGLPSWATCVCGAAA
jgi:hypothetical protein